jgi:hypothetical protein
VETRRLELLRSLVCEDPGDLRGVAGVVDLLGTGGGAVAAEVAPLQSVVGEDADYGAALTAYRDGLFVFWDLVCGGGDGGERDLERLGVDRAQVRECVLDLLGGRLGEAVGALPGGLVGVRVRMQGCSRPDSGPRGCCSTCPVSTWSATSRANWVRKAWSGTC